MGNLSTSSTAHPLVCPLHTPQGVSLDTVTWDCKQQLSISRELKESFTG